MYKVSIGIRTIACGAFFLGFALAETGCEVKAPWSPYDEIQDGGTADPATGEVDETSAAMQGITLLDIGDIEQTVYVEVALDEASQADNIMATTTTVDPGKRVALLTVDITPPVPKELWLKYSVKSRNVLDEEPVVLRGWIQRKTVELGKMAFALGEEARNGVEGPRINAFDGLSISPETMMITVKSEACILPLDTDPSTVDPWTTTTDRLTRAVKTPPVRINILASGTAGQPAGAEVTVETPAADAAPADAAPADAAPADAAPIDAAPIDAAPIDAAPIDAAPADAAPADAAQADAAQADAAPADTAPADAAAPAETPAENGAATPGQ